jgi:hypothetical protein
MPVGKRQANLRAQFTTIGGATLPPRSQMSLSLDAKGTAPKQLRHFDPIVKFCARTGTFAV